MEARNLFVFDLGSSFPKRSNIGDLATSVNCALVVTVLVSCKNIHFYRKELIHLQKVGVQWRLLQKFPHQLQSLLQKWDLQWCQLQKCCCCRSGPWCQGFHREWWPGKRQNEQRREATCLIPPRPFCTLHSYALQYRKISLWISDSDIIRARGTDSRRLNVFSKNTWKDLDRRNYSM